MIALCWLKPIVMAVYYVDDGVKVGVNDFIIKATAVALQASVLIR